MGDVLISGRLFGLRTVYAALDPRDGRLRTLLAHIPPDRCGIMEQIDLGRFVHL